MYCKNCQCHGINFLSTHPVRSGPRQLLAGAAQGVRVAALEVGVFNAAEELAEPTRCQGLLTVAR